MAEIDDPIKVFNFAVMAAGLNPYMVQECDLPDVDFDVIEHGQDNQTIGTAGMIKIGDFTLTNLRPVEGGSNWIWAWIQGIQSQLFGGGQLASQYKRNIDVVQYAPDNITIVDRWRLEGVFPKKINGLKLSKTKSENSMDSITFHCDKCQKVL